MSKDIIFERYKGYRDAFLALPVVTDPESTADGPELAGVKFDNAQYEDEVEYIAIDFKQLYRAEGHPVDWDYWHEQLKIARDYYLWRGETEMAGDVDDTIADSAPRHQAALARRKT